MLRTLHMHRAAPVERESVRNEVFLHVFGAGAGVPCSRCKSTARCCGEAWRPITKQSPKVQALPASSCAPGRRPHRSTVET